MKKVFILYSQNGETKIINVELEPLLKEFKQKLQDWKNYGDEDNVPPNCINDMDTYWINQYEVDQEGFCIEAREVLISVEMTGECPDDLSSF